MPFTYSAARLRDTLTKVITAFGYVDLRCIDCGPLIGSRPCPPPDDLTLTHHTSVEAANLMDELCDAYAYADAYGAVPGEDTHEKSSAFRDRATAALLAVNYSLVTAHVGDQLVGFTFGYGLQPERGWWEVLQPEPPEGFTVETGSRTVVSDLI